MTHQSPIKYIYVASAIITLIASSPSASTAATIRAKLRPDAFETRMTLPLSGKLSSDVGLCQSLREPSLVVPDKKYAVAPQKLFGGDRYAKDSQRTTNPENRIDATSSNHLVFCQNN